MIHRTMNRAACSSSTEAHSSASAGSGCDGACSGVSACASVRGLDLSEAMRDIKEDKVEKVSKKKIIKPAETVDILKEEVVTQDNKKIHLNRFDLFDEDEE